MHNQCMLYKRCITKTSPEVEDAEGLAANATKHLYLLKEKDKADGIFHMARCLYPTVPQYNLCQLCYV